jgi:SAM-dependent methyltransferase
VALHSGNAGDVGFYVSQVLGEEALYLPFETLEEPLEEHFEFLAPNKQRAALKAQTPSVSVLELGCGAGRVALPLLEGGARVVGVDTHAGLLSLLQATAEARGLEPHLKLIEADMRSLNLKERFDVVLITYNTLYCALTWDEQVDCLARAAAHLKPQGKLLIDGYALPNPEEYSYESDDEFEPLTVVELPELEGEALPSSLWRLSDLKFVPLSALDDTQEAQETQDPQQVAHSVSLTSEGEDEELAEEELVTERHVGVEERDVHEQEAQRCDVYYRFSFQSSPSSSPSSSPLSTPSNTPQKIEKIAHRYIFPHQLPEMLESAGLELSGWWLDFEPHTPVAEGLDEAEQWALSATLKGSSRLARSGGRKSKGRRR